MERDDLSLENKESREPRVTELYMGFSSHTVPPVSEERQNIWWKDSKVVVKNRVDNSSLRVRGTILQRGRGRTDMEIHEQLFRDVNVKIQLCLVIWL